MKRIGTRIQNKTKVKPAAARWATACAMLLGLGTMAAADPAPVGPARGARPTAPLAASRQGEGEAIQGAYKLAPASAARSDAKSAALAAPLSPESLSVATGSPSAGSPGGGSRTAVPPVAFPFHAGDTVAFVGSSSTQIGTWPQTVEFLLRTRHPQLQLSFRRDGIGGATFSSAADAVEAFVDQVRPEVVFLNFGANDAGAGERGLGAFESNMRRCVESTQAVGARAVLVTPQSADARRCGAQATGRRRLYAEDMLAFASAHGWSVLDVHHPLASLQARAQADDGRFTINRDGIHLTEASYVAWGFFVYQSLTPPPARSAVELSADGRCLGTEGCSVEGVESRGGVLSFTRRDRVLPILPPTALPPGRYVPLEQASQYLLKVAGLRRGAAYEVRCEGMRVGTATAEQLAAGVNLNALVLAGGRPAPWLPLARRLWAGATLEDLGPLRLRYEVAESRPLPAGDLALRDLMSGDVAGREWPLVGPAFPGPVFEALSAGVSMEPPAESPAAARRPVASAAPTRAAARH